VSCCPTLRAFLVVICTNDGPPVCCVASDQNHDGYLTHEELVNAVGDYRDRHTLKTRRAFPL
jgi:hypothetical protein